MDTPGEHDTDAGLWVVSLSDLHLGDRGSLLTDIDPATGEVRPGSLSPAAEALVACLRQIVTAMGAPGGPAERPLLVLNGDILEMALARVDRAVQVFERFVSALVHESDGRPLFSEIIMVPGNHDHHLWESARQTQYVHALRDVPAGARLPRQHHTTPVFFEGPDAMISSYLLSNLLLRWPGFEQARVRVAYPSFGLRHEGSVAVFHHGHFTESIYRLVSTVRDLLVDRNPPSTLEELEAENFAWIDFFWSSLGRSGRAGQTVASVYEHLGDKTHFDRMLRQLCKGLARRYDLPGWGDWMEAKLLYWVLRHVVRALRARERSKVETSLSAAAQSGVASFLHLLSPELGDPPPEVLTFVFGHTHKPFADFLEIQEMGRVPVYNSGGWVVDTVTASPTHGATVVLGDRNLRFGSIRLYAEGRDGPPSVRVLDAPAGPRQRGLEALARTGALAEFPAVAADAVRVRARDLSRRLERLR